MVCADVRDLLHGYADGELDLVRSLEIERHLRDCPGCAREYHALRSLQGAIRNEALRFTPPTALRERVRSSLRQADPETGERRVRWRRLAVAASLALVAASAWGVASFWPRPPRGTPTEEEVVASHVRSLMPGHVPGVKSEDKHTVKPWFNGKVPFTFPVDDFKEQGFRLAGGRLDRVAGRDVAGLIYHRDKHVINLLIWPAPREPDRPPQALAVQGYNVFHWTRKGLTYWAVSDLNAAALEEFARLVRQQ